ncbi:hypothetical protein BDY19DRAFT_950658 [Irpex rosettiformis]|uniref:Uncharacterized protein n=1 Tax=Irpex rosettiformis TaxID=378272 RepID=A0ACB8U251_9APHY|nr:hypothetical protein BDY19DRAFT_950658 [Irpex rosettiformis]
MPPNDSDVDLSRPLLQDDELGSESPLFDNDFREQRDESAKPGSVRSRLHLYWRRRKRYIVLGLSYTAAVVLLAIVILIAIAPKTPGADIDVPPFNETLAYDPRLEKYQSPNDAATCPTWSPPLPHSSLTTTTNTSQFTSTISFTLPSDPSLTFFLTRGAPLLGNFIINRDRANGKEIAVDVIAEFDDEEIGKKVLESTKACFAGRVEGDAKEQGVLLWADPALDSFSPSPHVRFNISVHLANIREFYDISTDFTNPGTAFAHEIADFLDLWSPTAFGVVKLNARNAAMSVGTMLGPASYISTTNAKIDGSFWISEAAHVQTSNAPVRGTVFALGHGEGSEVSVSIRTENAPVFAAMAIASDFSYVKLNSTISTSNGALTVIGPRSMVTPYPSLFVLSGITSNAPAIAHLHPEFEGSFDLATAGVGWGGKAEVVWDENAGGRDPAGKGRTRRLDWSEGRRDRRRKSGRIVWGEEVVQENMGDVRLYTTGKDVTVVAQKAS